jgi:serine/threonine-protein phosphatase 6 regulatory ankyrin repeat subunit A/serine/threonine-protein phosphatase 6 regulatory ankyrin repeat subunit B
LPAEITRLSEALINAITSGQERDTKIMIERGADVNARNKYGVSALTLAASHDWTDTVDLLIAKGADTAEALINSMEDRRGTAARILIEKGADVTAKNKDGVSVLRLAISQERTFIAHLLIEKGAHCDDALIGAITSGNETLANTLIDQGANVNAKSKEGVTALTLAVARGLTGTVRLLITKGAHCDEALMSAALIGAITSLSENTAEILIEKGADVNSKNQDGISALMIAASRGLTGTVRLLIAKGADKTAALIDTISSRQERTATILIERGADVNAKNTEGVSALKLADSECMTNVLDLLISKGADCDEAFMNEVLISAITRLNENTAKILINKGANVNAKNMDGIPILKLAASQGLTDTVSLLIAKGAYCNEALITAIECGQENLAKSLIEKGLDVNVKNKDGVPALVLAASQGFSNLVTTLILKGAEMGTSDRDKIMVLMDAHKVSNTLKNEVHILDNVDKPTPVYEVQPPNKVDKPTTVYVQNNYSSSSTLECPRCGSTQITSNTKGFSLGEAAVGGAFLGPVGLLAGFIGNKKVLLTCLNCGYTASPPSDPLF